MKILIIRMLLYIWEPTYLRTGCCCVYMRIDISENQVRLKNIEIWQPDRFSPAQKNYIYENRPGSHNIMREPGPAGSHKKSVNRPTLVFSTCLLTTHMDEKWSRNIFLSNLGSSSVGDQDV
jgi:hypothetical protein